MATLNEFNQTPVGEARYAFITNPVKFVNGAFVTKNVAHTDGIFTITQVFDPSTEEGAAFLKTLKDLEKQALTAAKADPKNKGKTLTFVSGVNELPDDSGLYSVKFKTKAATGDGTEKTIPVFDSGDPPKKLETTPRIGNGSKTTIAYNPVQTQFGVKVYLSLYLCGVQVVELVEPSSSMGFTVKSGGFTGKAGRAGGAADKDGGSMAAQIEAASDNSAY
jgi:translation initiation factor 1 (eIF-1/SUI1)